MRQLEAALRQIAERAEPLPTEVLIARIETELGWVGAPWAVAESEEPTMVTRQDPDLEIPTPTSQQRSRRGPLLAAAAAVVVILVGAGIAFASGLFDSDTDIAAEAPAIVEDYADAMIAGDPDAIAALYTPDGVGEDRAIPRSATTTAGIRDLVAVGSAYMDVTDIDLQSVVIGEGVVIVEWTWSGMSSNVNRSPTDKTPFSTDLVTVFEIEDDLIAKSVSYYDVDEFWN